MTRLGLLGTIAISYPATALAERRQSNTNHQLPAWLEDPVWKTIAQVQETLFPAAEDIPGASDIGAAMYLHKAIENPNADGEDRDFIFRGTGWLDELAQQRYTRNFIQLTEKEQEKINKTKELINSANSLFRSRDYKGAIKKYDAAIKMIPNHGKAYYYRGMALKKLSKFKDSERSLKKAAEFLPNEAGPYYQLGSLYTSMGNTTDAINFYNLN